MMDELLVDQTMKRNECFYVFVVLASFRGTVQHGLPLEIGDTVQILEKCEGKLLICFLLQGC